MNKFHLLILPLAMICISLTARKEWGRNVAFCLVDLPCFVLVMLLTNHDPVAMILMVVGLAGLGIHGIYADANQPFTAPSWLVDLFDLDVA